MAEATTQPNAPATGKKAPQEGTTQGTARQRVRFLGESPFDEVRLQRTAASKEEQRQALLDEWHERAGQMARLAREISALSSDSRYELEHPQKQVALLACELAEMLA